MNNKYKNISKIKIFVFLVQIKKHKYYKTKKLKNTYQIIIKILFQHILKKLTIKIKN